ncbi:alpha-L-glutamate ligase-like protein [Litorivivens sp.]|uniref:alpha-L-glutamate ligase-like protein n=1 Tax=Litorivivens sp. TaxID=2020868 RepID=UPI00356AD397
MITWARRLRERGIVGINQRNAEFIMPYNPRNQFPLVDDKKRTKLLAIENNIAVPELYATVEIEHDVRNLSDTLKPYSSFVIKPNNGSGGNGVLVVTSRIGDHFAKASGQIMSSLQVQRYTSNILSGMYSLGGVPDTAIIEYRVESDPFFDAISYQGVPDIRVIVFRGVPVASMLRLPTRDSDGKANLHQGAIGVGIDIKTGITRSGVRANDVTKVHPDTLQPIDGLQLPYWETIMTLAARCSEMVGLNYIGVDLVIDRDKGPLMLELNARPGLNVQLATGRGLLFNLRLVEQMENIPTRAEDRVALACEKLY